MLLRNEQVQSQQQTQQQVQTQQLTPQQVLLVRLTEMPLDALQQRIETECLENPWLERNDSEEEGGSPVEADNSYDDSYTDETAGDRSYDYSSEDDMPDFMGGQSRGNATEWASYDDTLSLYDHLLEQMADFELSEHDAELLEYLIGTVDSDGLIRKPLYQIADEAEIYQDIATSEEELTEVLKVLWQFDPPGIGARSLKECLLLQVERSDGMPRKELLTTILRKYYDDFTHKRWDRLQNRLHLTDVQIRQLQNDIRRLNPRPGNALGGKSVDRVQTIQPDILVEVDDDGIITVSLTRGNMPSLSISPDADASNAFVRQYVDSGQAFINALRQRAETMMRTMRVIVELQKPFFLEGDETLLRPMVLDDVAQRTGYDISTISRVSNSKYVQTPFGTYPLKWFFTHSFVQKEGGEGDATSHEVMAALRRHIEAEDKRHPLSDDKLTALLKADGYDIARRTVAKYREKLRIPKASMRK